MNCKVFYFFEPPHFARNMFRNFDISPKNSCFRKTKKRTPRLGYPLLWRSSRDSFASSPLAKIKDSLGRALASDTPPACHIGLFESHFSDVTSPHPNGWGFVTWRSSRDSNPGGTFMPYEISSHASSTSLSTAPNERRYYISEYAKNQGLFAISMILSICLQMAS